MALNENISALLSAAAKARQQFDAMIERADGELENARADHATTIAASAARVAELQSQLELAIAFERERDAAQIRREIAAAEDAHRRVVDEANERLRAAVERHVRAFSCAAVAMEASVNAAVAKQAASR